MMGIVSILLIAVALAMDAFAVALATGMRLGVVSRRQVFRLAWHFGFFQTAMTILGWIVGMGVEAGVGVISYIEDFGKPLAAGLLLLVGGRMIYEALNKNRNQAKPLDPTRGKTLIILAVATSIDAWAVGLSFAFLIQTIWWPALLIGITAALLTIFGLRLGCRLSNSARMGRRAEVIGGVILVIMALRILADEAV